MSVSGPGGDQTKTGTETGATIGIRPRLGLQSGSDWDQNRGRDHTGPGARAMTHDRSVPAPFKVAVSPCCAPSPGTARAAAAPLLCPAVRGPGALVGAPPEQLRPTGGTGAPLPPGTGSTGRSQPVATGDPAQAAPAAAGISQARLLGAGPRNPLSPLPPPFPSRFPRDPSCSRVSQFWEVTVGRGIQSTWFPILAAHGLYAALLPGSSRDLARAACGYQPPARAEAVTGAGEAAAAVCPVRHRGSVGSVGDGLAVP